jgi:ubiquinone/menaquinone biosynthesis C-methylase UbiE
MSEQRAPKSTEAWESGEQYEPYVGRWSRLVAREFLAWLDISTRARWLDVGCGTGALIQAILDDHAPAEVVGIDPSSSYIAYARRSIRDPRVRYEVGDARALPVASSYDAVVSGLVINFVPVPDQLKAAREMVRAARVGGTVAAYVWDYPGEMQLMTHFWAAAVALDSDALSLDEAARFDFCRPEPLRALFTDAGLSDVDVDEIVVPTDFPDFDAYWTPFLGGTGTAPAYAMSLSEKDRTALADALRARLPTADDGSIHLTARAWVVRGTAR